MPGHGQALGWGTSYARAHFHVPLNLGLAQAWEMFYLFMYHLDQTRFVGSHYLIAIFFLSIQKRFLGNINVF